MLTLTFAGDEAGDVSFAFGKGASRCFVIAVIATEDPTALRGLLEEVRQASDLPGNYEFKFHALTSASLRQRVFAALQRAQFESWAIIVDKTVLPDTFKMLSGLDFYLYFVSELIRSIPAEKREGATLILDEFGSAEKLRLELRRVLNLRGIPRHFKKVLVKRSKSEPLIQVADLMAGALLRRDTKGDAEAFDTVENKMRGIMEFHP